MNVFRTSVISQTVAPQRAGDEVVVVGAVIQRAAIDSPSVPLGRARPACAERARLAPRHQGGAPGARGVRRAAEAARAADPAARAKKATEEVEAEGLPGKGRRRREGGLSSRPWG